MSERYCLGRISRPACSLLLVLRRLPVRASAGQTRHPFDFLASSLRPTPWREVSFPLTPMGIVVKSFSIHSCRFRESWALRLGPFHRISTPESEGRYMELVLQRPCFFRESRWSPLASGRPNRRWRSWLIGHEAQSVQGQGGWPALAGEEIAQLASFEVLPSQIHAWKRRSPGAIWAKEAQINHLYRHRPAEGGTRKGPVPAGEP